MSGLLQIADPLRKGTPIGIDLGTTNSLVARVVRSKPECMPVDDAGGRLLPSVVYFDPATGLPRKVTYESVAIAGPPQPVEENFSDFRDVSGVKVPFRVDILQGGRPFAAVTVQDYKINTGLKPEGISTRP